MPQIVNEKSVPFFHVLVPVLFLLLHITYGLILQLRVFQKEAFPLEIVFLLAAFFSAAHLLCIGFKWNDIQTAMPQWQCKRSQSKHSHPATNYCSIEY